jgi:nucleoside-diphosphate-sugar epimerase
LIFGGGYLGQRVANRWKANGDEVTVLTRSSERAGRLLTEGFRAIVGDVMQPHSLADLPIIETVLYSVGFDRSGPHPKRAVYVDGLRNALTQIQDRCERLVFISSTSVYGQSAGELVDENSPTEPSEENGRICVEAEKLVGEFFNDNDHRSANILRLAGIYGPGRLLTRIEQLKRHEPLTGNATAWLNLIHVDDAAQTVLDVNERGQRGATYLVSDDRPVFRSDYYSALADKVGAPSPRFVALAADSPERQRINKRCVNRRIRRDLNVELQYPTITEGLNALPELTPQPTLPRE